MAYPYNPLTWREALECFDIQEPDSTFFQKATILFKAINRNKHFLKEISVGLMGSIGSVGLMGSIGSRGYERVRWVRGVMRGFDGFEGFFLVFVFVIVLRP